MICPLALLVFAHTLIPVMQDSDSPDKQSPIRVTDLTTHLACTAGMTPMAAHPGVRSASEGPCCSRSTTRTPRRLRRPWVSHLPDKKRKEKTMPFGVNLVKSQVSYQVAYLHPSAALFLSLVYSTVQPYISLYMQLCIHRFILIC